MKPKKMQRKLQLNKKTLVNLNDPEMGHLQGGVDQTLAQTNCAECFGIATKTCSCAESACLSCMTDCVSDCSAVGACCP